MPGCLCHSCTNSDGSDNDDNNGSSSSDEYSNSETESESEPIEAEIVTAVNFIILHMT